MSQVAAAAIPALPSALTPATSPLNGALDTVDPMTRYSVATAVYQEVQLLNRYVRDAALQTHSRPLVVRLHISLLPQIRDQAYDAYSMLSFLFGEGSVLTPYARTNTYTPSSSRNVSAPMGVPTVVPLLVTDSLEQSASAASLSRLRGFGLALQAMQAGFGASAEVARQVESLQAAIGQDSNSLLTVTKVATNVLRVRFGAVQQVASGLAMQPRNHTVTVLVLVPDTAVEPKVNVLSKLEVVKATDGKSLPERPFGNIQQQVYDVVCRYKTGCTQLLPAEQPFADQLAYAVQAESNADFGTALTSLTINSASTQRLWTDLLEALSRSPYTATSFFAPPLTPAPTIPEQAVLAVDDGTKTTVQLRGLVGDTASSLVGELIVSKGSSSTPFLSEAADISRGIVRLAFPSAQRLRGCDPSTCTVSLTLYWTQPTNRWNPSGGHTPIRAFANTSLVTAATPPRKNDIFFTVASGTRSIGRSAKSEGTVRLIVTPDADHSEDMFITVDGADVLGVTPAAQVALTDNGWQLKATSPPAPFVATVTLTGLDESVDVRVTATNGKAAREPMIFRVKTLK